MTLKDVNNSVKQADDIFSLFYNLYKVFTGKPITNENSKPTYLGRVR